MRDYLGAQLLETLAAGLDEDVCEGGLFECCEGNVDDFGVRYLRHKRSMLVFWYSRISKPCSLDGYAVTMDATCLCSQDEFIDNGARSLLERVEDEGERAGAVAEVEELLQQQETVRAPVSLG